MIWRLAGSISVALPPDSIGNEFRSQTGLGTHRDQVRGVEAGSLNTWNHGGFC